MDCQSIEISPLPLSNNFYKEEKKQTIRQTNFTPSGSFALLVE